MTEADRELLARIVARDEAAFELLCAQHQAQLRHHLARMVGAPDAAEDLLQDTLLRIWTYAGQWDGRGTPRAWIFQVATNVALNALRADRRRPHIPLDSATHNTPSAWLADPALGPEELAERAEDRTRLRSLIAELPEEKREVLRMIHSDELSVEEVARALGIPSGTVRSRLHYATRRLARAWEDGAGD
jgi:RNA polymerase sigma-70 factor, ECF subfamily